MSASCAAAGVNLDESRKNWNSKSINARLSYNKTARFKRAAEPGSIPEQLQVNFHSTSLTMPLINNSLICTQQYIYKQYNTTDN